MGYGIHELIVSFDGMVPKEMIPMHYCSIGLVIIVIILYRPCIRSALDDTLINSLLSSPSCHVSQYARPKCQQRYIFA